LLACGSVPGKAPGHCLAWLKLAVCPRCTDYSEELLILGWLQRCFTCRHDHSGHGARDRQVEDIPLLALLNRTKPAAARLTEVVSGSLVMRRLTTRSACVAVVAYSVSPYEVLGNQPAARVGSDRESDLQRQQRNGTRSYSSSPLSRQKEPAARCRRPGRIGNRGTEKSGDNSAGWTKDRCGASIAASKFRVPRHPGVRSGLPSPASLGLRLGSEYRCAQDAGNH
jgi:hypothetical protein